MQIWDMLSILVLLVTLCIGAYFVLIFMAGGALGMFLGILVGAVIDRAVTIALELPDPILRKQHWQRAATSHPIGLAAPIARR